jgi:hypothetical protein
MIPLLIISTPQQKDWRISALSNLNGALGPHGKRDRQTAHCCGHRYERWRIIGGKFPPGHRICGVCKKPLPFKSKSTQSTTSTLSQKESHS